MAFTIRSDSVVSPPLVYTSWCDVGNARAIYVLFLPEIGDPPQIRPNAIGEPLQGKWLGFFKILM